MMDMVPTPFVHVHQASMDIIAPTTSTTVPQPLVYMEAPVMVDMVPTPIVHVHRLQWTKLLQ